MHVRLMVYYSSVDTTSKEIIKQYQSKHVRFASFHRQTLITYVKHQQPIINLFIASFHRRIEKHLTRCNSTTRVPNGSVLPFTRRLISSANVNLHPYSPHSI